LAPRGSKQEEEWWYIESFLPLACRDLSRWISITNVAGIPIALDGSKARTMRSARVAALAGRKKEHRNVASSLEEFVKLEAKDVPGRRVEAIRCFA
jgi:hypothetical protein